MSRGNQGGHYCYTKCRGFWEAVFIVNAIGGVDEPIMGASETALHWLRPLVESKNWDYCVIWRLGDDPSRFIEWVGCCCCGAYGVLCNVKKEKGVEQDLGPLCRDVHVQHHVRTMACEALASFPTSIPLYSGIRGEVVILKEPKWLIHGYASDSKAPDGTSGTQVLIPVAGGLIELYSSRLIPKDQKTIEFVKNRFKFYVEEAMNDMAYFSMSRQQQALDLSLHCADLLATAQLSQVSEPCSNPSIHGSSTGSTPASTERLQCDSVSNLVSLSESFNQSNDLFKEKMKLHCNQHPTTMKIDDLSLSCVTYDIARNAVVTGQKRQRGQYRSKNLVTERNRRNKIKDGLFALRALVPNITKMDRASILADAIDYVRELQQIVKELEDELNEIDEDDASQRIAQHVTPDLNEERKDSEQTSKKSQSSCSISNNVPKKAHVEVNQIDARVFMLRFIGKHSRGGFSRLMEIMDSLGLQVLDANVTTLNEEVLSIFRAEAKADGMCNSQTLEYALIELTN
ncbi:PREDICTED: transcription factor ABORTED MICROSPORES [Ipomoea nil]|uniref:transcription factor ABORTED MICROSPORES n=1 Tax=Ipomoea nil TaxID=35883 RepID=UPI00090094C4|nr:PREDICTED: transcription factor ABORTED MICROSPORES [Ipomoea nil]